MFGLGSKSIVGLDVGSSSIKAVELKKKGGQIEVAHLGLEPLSSDIVVDSMIVDSGTVSSAIAKLFLDNQIKTKAVATAVSGHSVIVKKISLPSMSDQELAETIEKEAAQHIPFDLADVSLDYQILSDEVGSPQMDVLLVAVKKDKILNYTNVLSMAGRTPAIVDIDALALQNCYEYNYQPAPGQVVALLNLGASVMNINIVKGTTPLFPRDVSVGGHQYTDSLQKELDLSFEDAESLKLGNKVGTPQMDVLLVAVKKDKILNYTNVLSMAGRTPAIVDIDALALQNCCEYNYQPAPGQVVALLNLGASVMNINIVKGTTPLFPRDVSVGGHQYTDSLQKELDLSFDDAESLKLGNKVGTVSEDAKQPILQQVTEIIVLEIQKTFDFFRASAAGEHIEKIYLAGGSSKVPGLVEALRQEFSMPVELLNPFQRVTPPVEGHGAELVEQNPGQMAVAVGLALRSFESL